MKKFISMLLVLSLVFVMFIMTACNNETEGEDTNAPANDTQQGGDTQAPADDEGDKADDTQAPADDGNKETEPVETEPADEEDEENMFPYEGDIIPNSVASFADGGYAWGAPDESSVYLPVDPANVIHDGKGTWNNQENTVATYVFDMDATTFYDCDEGCGTENSEAMNVGMYDFESWDGDTEKTGYVGAYYEGGVYLTQIRWFGRSANADRNAGGYFEASTDGENWETIYTIEENSLCIDYEFVDIDEAFQGTAYTYIRYVGPKEGYCNIAEIEFWGSYAG